MDCTRTGASPPTVTTWLAPGHTRLARAPRRRGSSMVDGIGAVHGERSWLGRALTSVRAAPRCRACAAPGRPAGRETAARVAAALPIFSRSGSVAVQAHGFRPAAAVRDSSTCAAGIDAPRPRTGSVARSCTSASRRPRAGAPHRLRQPVRDATGSPHGGAEAAAPADDCAADTAVAADAAAAAVAAAAAAAPACGADAATARRLPATTAAAAASRRTSAATTSTAAASTTGRTRQAGSGRGSARPGRSRNGVFRPPLTRLQRHGSRAAAAAPAPARRRSSALRQTVCASARVKVASGSSS